MIDPTTIESYFLDSSYFHDVIFLSHYSRLFVVKSIGETGLCCISY